MSLISSASLDDEVGDAFVDALPNGDYSVVTEGWDDPMGSPDLVGRRESNVVTVPEPGACALGLAALASLLARGKRPVRMRVDGR